MRKTKQRHSVVLTANVRAFDKVESPSTLEGCPTFGDGYFKGRGRSSRIVHHTLSKKRRQNLIKSWNRSLTISQYNMHEPPTSLLPQYHRFIYSEGKDHRFVDDDAAPHQAEICFSEIKLRAPVLIGGSRTKPPGRDGQSAKNGQLFCAYSSFDKALIHPSEVGGTKGEVSDFPLVIAH